MSMTSGENSRGLADADSDASGGRGSHPWILAQILFERRDTQPRDANRASARESVARLSRALRAERRRGRAGHWTYDLNRHIALAQALKAETRRLRMLERKERAPCGARSR